MPEMKRTLQTGRMNRNNDERLVRPGESREALNINIGRSDSSDIGAVENILGNVEINSTEYIDDGVVIGSYIDTGNDRIYFFVTSNNSPTEDNEGEHAVYVYNQRTNSVRALINKDIGQYLNFHQNYLITGINFVDELLFWTDDRNEPRKINVTRALNQSSFYDRDEKTTLIRLSPILPPRVTQVATTGNSSNFLQDKFVRFAYRYKFNDGEFSTISPLTPVAFRSITSRTLTSTDYLAGAIAEFVNQAKQVFLEIEVPVNVGITAVEILYNESSNTNMYILEELAAETDSPTEDPIIVSYTYDSQDPFRAIPASQITRVYDAVPRKAKSQELAGGRIVFGNYLQNYNLPSLSFQVNVANVADDETNPFNRFSVKTRRTYQVGIVLADKFGRLSPVILSSTGGDTIFVDPIGGSDAMQQLTVEINNPDAIPDWAVSYRIVVKNRIQEYYNFFFIDHSGDDFTISGGNINKVPRDTTDETVFVGDVAVAQSTIKLYPKLQGGINNVSTEVLAVDSIKYGTGGDGLPDATIYNSGFSTGGAGVFETVPRESNLDIFYETSTAGLVSDITSDPIPVDYYNCYILNMADADAHLELNRIRAEFNAQWFPLGLKAYAVQDNFAEQRRFNTLIHSSSFFNSRVGLNNINQFNEAEGGLTVSLDPADGSIQKLYAEDTLLIICQEDKISRSPIDKDFVYTAEGGAIPVTSSTQYLGTISPYAGEYGISKNPESFAVYGNRKYFTDKVRGVALRLSGDGITEISEKGLTDFFRDALALSTKVIGSFDEYHDQYNCTIVGTPAYCGSPDTDIATGRDGYFTVSYEEEVGGWPSFKSFQQEGGYTLNNRYYTFNGGKIWEHNHRDAKYNNFYGGQHSSMVEVIFNDQPSDIKEFKTVNYEGLSGWKCNTITTDLETLSIDPDGSQQCDVVIASLNVSESVSNGRISQVETQTIVDGTTYRWVIKVQPATSEHVFDSPTNVTVTFDGEVVNGLLGEDGNLYFISDYQLANFEVDPTPSFDVTIEGAAVRDTSGAILIIRVIDEVNENDVFTFIPDFNQFRGGPNVFEFISDADNPTVNLEARIDTDSDFEFAEDALEVTWSDNITDLRSALPLVNQSLDVIRYEQAITLPSIQTNGTVTISDPEENELLRLKPGVSLAPFTKSGDITTFEIEHLMNDVLSIFGSQTAIQRVFSGTSASFVNYFIVPNWDDEDLEASYIIPSDDSITLTGDSNLVTFTATRIESSDNAELIGAYELTMVTNNRPQTENRFDTSHDIVLNSTISVVTAPVDQWLHVLRRDGVEHPNDIISGDTSDPIQNLTIEVTDFKDAAVESSTEHINVSFENDMVETVEAGMTYDIVVASDIPVGEYTVTFTPLPKVGYRAPNEFTPVVITIDIAEDNI